MSARQLQRLQKEKGGPSNKVETLPEAAAEEEEEKSGEEKEAAGTTGAFNAFSALRGGESEVEGEEEEEEEKEGGSGSEKRRPAAVRQAGRRKPKKKAKQPVAPATPRPASTVQTFNKTPVPPTEAEKPLAPVLSVSSKKLQAGAELRRMFGKVSDADEEEDKSGGLTGHNRRMRRAIARGAVRRVPLQVGLLIRPRDTWPPYTGGVSMTLLRGESFCPGDTERLFVFQPSAAYQAVQSRLYQLQSSHDPNQIVALLQEHPYHFDALMLMSDLYRMHNNQEQADELLQQALYGLELSFHPLFTPWSADCRLEYVGLNEIFFNTIFRYAQMLTRRGLHHTSLEVAKLVLGLNEGDPCGVLFCIDFFALRAQEYAWLLRFGDEFSNGEAALNMLPNWAYSLALARLRQATTSQRGKGGAGASSEAEGLAALVEAIQLHPLALVRLLAKLQEKGLAKDTVWQSLLRAPLFAQATDEGSLALNHVTELFVGRSHTIWQAPETLAWLKHACQRALSSAGTAANMAAARREGFPASRHNEYRHLSRSSIWDSVEALPAEEAVRLGAHEAGRQLAFQAGAPPAAEQVLAEVGMVLDAARLQGMHPLQALAATLLPWLAVEGVLPEEGEEGPIDDATEQRVLEGLNQLGLQDVALNGLREVLEEAVRRQQRGGPDAGEE